MCFAVFTGGAAERSNGHVKDTFCGLWSSCLQHLCAGTCTHVMSFTFGYLACFVPINQIVLNIVRARDNIYPSFPSVCIYVQKFRENTHGGMLRRDLVRGLKYFGAIYPDRG